MLDEGFLINNTSARTVRMLPPLVIDEEDLDALVAAFRRVLPPLVAPG
jgi:acetylornithine/succinyldiaminopimelate/putrescine aminotransferase